MAQHVRVFLDKFVRPLVCGGELHVGAPIPIADVERWDTELDAATVELVAVDEGRTNVLSSLVVRPPALVLEADELALAAGLHNALFLVHPRADAWSVSDRQRRRIIDNALTLVSQPLTQNKTRVMARHGLLHHLFHLSRRDTTVSWWTGRARFQGQTPSKRLVAWKGVRRVREEHVDVGFDELFAVPDTAPIVATLLRRTPLTQLLDSQPGAPPLHWEDAVFVLRDAELVRAVVAHLVPGGAPTDQVREPSRLAAAFEQMLERAPEEADVRAVAAFLCHISGLFALAEIHMREVNAKSPLVSTVLAAEAAGQRPRGLTTLLALPGALALVDPRLATPPGIAGVPALAARWRIQRQQTAELLSDAVIEALAQRLRRHLRNVETPAAATASASLS
jgi:hypothetical protein